MHTVSSPDTSDKHPTCEDRIEESLAERLRQYVPDIDEWTVTDCHERLEEYGGAERPDPDPWHMDRAALAELLESVSIQVVDEDSDDTLREAVIQAIDDEDLDGLEEWRDAAQESTREASFDSILSVEKLTTYKVCMSWGGPADYFELDFDAEGECVGGRYLFQDWFDGATRDIDTGQAEELAELWAIGPNYE